jgi:uncharacterized protein YdaU (DUF1376 family)
MAKGKSPSFQFYPDAWLSSTDVQLMSPAEEGAYFRLLCHAWMSEDCGLPVDDEALSVLSRLGAKWAKSGPRILKKFDRIGDRLFNPRLVEERQKQIEWRGKSSDGGKKSAASRENAKKERENLKEFPKKETPPPDSETGDKTPTEVSNVLSNQQAGSRVVEECLKDGVNQNSTLQFSSSSSSSLVTKTVTKSPRVVVDEIRQAWEWYKVEFPGEVNDFIEAQLFCSLMDAEDNLSSLKKNLPLWKIKWVDRYPPSSENFLSKRMFKITPKLDAPSPGVGRPLNLYTPPKPEPYALEIEAREGKPLV